MLLNTDFVQSALLRRLSDDDPAVLHTLLRLPSLLSLPGGQLVQALVELLARCEQAASGDAEKAVRKAMQANAIMVSGHGLMHIGWH